MILAVAIPRGFCSCRRGMVGLAIFYTCKARCQREVMLENERWKERSEGTESLPSRGTNASVSWRALLVKSTMARYS